MAVAVDALPDRATWHRLSPRMLLIHPVAIAGKAIPQLLGISFVGAASGYEQWPYAVAGLLGGLGLTKWFTTRLRITDQSVQVQEGLLFRKTKSTARDRIRTVDLTAHPMARVLGVTKLVIGTGSTREGGRLVLDGLTRSGALALRDELLHREVEHRAADPEVTELARFDRSWVRYGPFTLAALASALTVIGPTPQLLRDAGLTRISTVRNLQHSFHMLPVGARFALLVLWLFTGFVLLAVASYALTFWDFRLVRHEHGTLQVTRGLLTTRATSIERRRLVGASVVDAIGMRWVGAAATHAIATGLRGPGSTTLLPAAPAEAAYEVAARVLDGSDVLHAPLLPHPRTALRRRLVRAVTRGSLPLVGLLIGWAFGMPPGWLVVGVVVLGLAVAVGFDAYRNLGHVLDGGYLVTRHGSLNRHRSALSTGAVIGWTIRSTWFQRRLGLVSLTATTAAGHHGYVVIDASPAQALAVARTVSGELVEQFAT